MSDAETYSVVVSSIAILATIFVGWRQRWYETKLAKYELEDRERERAARNEADLRAEIGPRDGTVTIRNDGGADAVNLRVSLAYPNSARIDPEHGINVYRFQVERLPAGGGECQVPFFFLREHAVPPLNVTMRWTDAPTGKDRETTIPCYW